MHTKSLQFELQESDSDFENMFRFMIVEIQQKLSEQEPNFVLYFKNDANQAAVAVFYFE